MHPNDHSNNTMKVHNQDMEITQVPIDRLLV